MEECLSVALAAIIRGFICVYYQTITKDHINFPARRMTMARRKKPQAKPALKESPLDVELFEPKPNKMFPDWLTARLRFLRYSEPVACAECGKRKKTHWTLLCQFRVGVTHTFVITQGEKSHAPLTPVCRDHFLSPDWRGTIHEKEEATEHVRFTRKKKQLNMYDSRERRSN